MRRSAITVFIVNGQEGRPCEVGWRTAELRMNGSGVVRSGRQLRQAPSILRHQTLAHGIGAIKRKYNTTQI